MRVKLRIGILGLLMLLFRGNSFASHIMGADISYRYVSPFKYHITVKMYRDCSGIPLNNPDIRMKCLNGNNELVIQYTRTSISDISEHCTKNASPCYPQNTTAGFGVEEHVYEADIDFATAPFNSYRINGCCEVKISVEQCCRNGAITTISPGNFYTEAMLNVCEMETYKNSSPVFLSPPIESLCVNEIFSYSPGIVETDGEDSISFELVAPLNANNVNENYFSPFTPQKPLTVFNSPQGFVFDKSNGNMTILPTNSSQVGVIVVQVSEWRKDSSGLMRKIGFVRREMEIIIKNCGNANNAPYMTGLDKFSVCEGEKLCFSINSKDDMFLPNQSVADTVFLEVVNQIDNSTFVLKDSAAREKEAEFCWRTSIGDGRAQPYTFTVIARDNNCSDPRLNYRGYTINIKPKAMDTRKYNKLQSGKLRFEAIAFDTTKEYQYSFDIYDSNMVNKIYSGQKGIDTFQFLNPGRYIISHIINNSKNNCPSQYYDTVNITIQHINSLERLGIRNMKLLPNPSNGFLRISGVQIPANGFKIEVISSDGRRVYSGHTYDGTIDLSELSEGNYVLKLESESSVFNASMVIFK